MKKTLISLLLFLLTVTAIMAQDLFPAKFPNGEYGFIDKNGNVKIEGIYEGAETLSKGVYLVKLRDKYGLLNSDLQLLLPIQFDSFHQDNGDDYLVSFGGKIALYNLRFNILSDYFDDIENFYYLVGNGWYLARNAAYSIGKTKSFNPFFSLTN